jgi:alpha-glucosidase (family GH31 glycosyl hydrolase)
LSARVAGHHNTTTAAAVSTAITTAVSHIVFGDSSRSRARGATGVEGTDPERMHNYCTQLYNQAVFELLQEERGEGEAMLFARSATACAGGAGKLLTQSSGAGTAGAIPNP